MDFPARFAANQGKQTGQEAARADERNGANSFERFEAHERIRFSESKTGTKLNNIKRSFHRAVTKAGIEDFRFHNLRHTAATRMADAGADVFTLMKILGHSDIRMTRRYMHATDAALRRAVTNLDGKSEISGFK